MNYIKQLQSEIVESSTRRDDAVEKITDFLIYLQSSKFHANPTIQVNEVTRFLLELRINL